MTLRKSVGGYFPRPLLLITASVLPVAITCFYLSQIRDVRPAAEAMSRAAVAARLAPVAPLLPASADTKIASGPAGLPTSN